MRILAVDCFVLFLLVFAGVGAVLVHPYLSVRIGTRQSGGSSTSMTRSAPLDMILC